MWGNDGYSCFAQRKYLNVRQWWIFIFCSDEIFKCEAMMDIHVLLQMKHLNVRQSLTQYSFLMKQKGLNSRTDCIFSSCFPRKAMPGSCFSRDLLQEMSMTFLEDLDTLPCHWHGQHDRETYYNQMETNTRLLTCIKNDKGYVDKTPHTPREMIICYLCSDWYNIVLTLTVPVTAIDALRHFETR